MKRLVALAALAGLTAGCATVEGTQTVEREIPQSVIEETAGSSTQHLLVPSIIGAGLFFAYLVATK